ncbi:MAG: dihydroorotate dehydrogenase [Chloroflexota bacterium]
MEPNLAVELAPNHKTGLLLRNPVLTASGTFGYGTEYASLIDIQRLGAIVCKGTTMAPREGNPQPRLHETPAGLLNSIGLQNVGVRAVVAEKAPIWAGWQVPVLVNIAGESVEEFAQLAAALDGVPGVAGLEVNISCPNVDAGYEAFGARPETAAAVTRAVVGATDLPVMVKLSPNAPDVPAVARAVAQAGAHSLSLINTLLGMAIDVRRRRPVFSRGAAGLSGPAVKPIALRLVYEVAQAVDLPLVAIGGIATADDALEFLLAGATAVQVGTASFANPRASLEVLDGISAYLRREGIADVRELVGAALPLARQLRV